MIVSQREEEEKLQVRQSKSLVSRRRVLVPEVVGSEAQLMVVVRNADEEDAKQEKQLARLSKKSKRKKGDGLCSNQQELTRLVVMIPRCG